MARFAIVGNKAAQYTICEEDWAQCVDIGWDGPDIIDFPSPLMVWMDMSTRGTTVRHDRADT
jgi:hypothetical protein